MPSSLDRAWGQKFSSEAMHVYIGEKIGSPIEVIILTYWVSNHHLVHNIHQIIGGLHNLCKFQWAITSCLSYVDCWRENIKTCRATLLWLMWHSNNLQLPSKSCSPNPYVMIMSHWSEGAYARCTLSILEAIRCNGSLRVAFSAKFRFGGLLVSWQ